MADPVVQQVATPAATPVPGSPEYDAAMAAKFDNVGVTPNASADSAPATKPTKPEGVPDKFWNAEKGEVDVTAMSKSYTELERAKSQPKPPVTPQTPTVDPVKVHADKKAELTKALDAAIVKEGATLEEITAARKALVDHGEPPAPVADAAQAAVSQAGLDMEALRAEYATKGELSEETFAKFEKAGFGRDVVEGYIEGQKALARERDGEAYAILGGEQEFTKMAEWAKSNMTRGEIEAFNKACATGTPDEMKLAVSGLKSKFESANGSEPTLQGGGNGVTVTSGFRSRAEMTAAMRDPRYETDTAYRRDVEQRVKDNTFGW